LDSNGCIIVEFFNAKAIDAIKSKVQFALFFAISCDETTLTDNVTLISAHAYICGN
jgi:hypothetical protein